MYAYMHGGRYHDKTIEYDLSENIGPLGVPKAVLDAVAKCPESFAKYPDAEYTQLREAIAKVMQVDAAQVALGNGADELIWKVIAAIKPASIIEIAPTFSEYRRAAKFLDIPVQDYVLTAPDFSLNDGAVMDFANQINKENQMVFICNPNNPTGKLIARRYLERILDKCQKVKAYMVVDESFLDFTDDRSISDLCNESGRLIVLRGFTKIYGMAGIRLGYSIAGKELSTKIRDFGPLWNVSAVAVAAGMAAIGDQAWIDETKRLVAAEKAYIESNIDTVLRSDANFMLIKTQKGMAGQLAGRGIAVRECHNFVGLDDTYIRIGIKNHSINKRFVEAYKEIIEIDG